MKKLPVAAAALMTVVAALSGPATAYQTGDMIVRAGAAMVDPHVDSDKLKEDGAVINPKKTVDVDSNTQFGLTATYMLGDNIGLELLVASPFRHEIKVKDDNSDATKNLTGKLGHTRQLPPTLTLQYYPMDDGSEFQPYVGLGVNYTKFFKEELTSTRKASRGGDYKNLELKDSWGVAIQLGTDFRIDDNWSINAAAWYVGIDTTATFKSKDGTKKYKVDVDLDPMVYMVGVAYKF